MAEALKTMTAPIRQSASVTPNNCLSGCRLRGIAILFPRAAPARAPLRSWLFDFRGAPLILCMRGRVVRNSGIDRNWSRLALAARCLQAARLRRPVAARVRACRLGGFLQRLRDPARFSAQLRQ